jgi:hypothetical protein
LEAVDRLVFQKQTIRPKKLESLKEGFDISKCLKDSFIAANKLSRTLEDSYGVLDPTSSMTGQRELKIFFDESRLQFADTKAVVGLSNIGIDYDSRQSLMYVEYFSPNRGLMGFYLLINIERYPPVKDIFVISRVDVVKVFRVV